MSLPAISIAPATEAQLPELMALSDRAGSAARWTAQQWADIFHTQNPPRLSWVARLKGAEARLAGFLVALCAGPDWELENVAVDAEFRRRGIGSALLLRLLEAARSTGAERVVLEVRASNEAAISIYRRAGFEPLGHRPGYYSNPADDALILVHRL